MVDPLGLIGDPGPVKPPIPPAAPGGGTRIDRSGGPTFMQTLEGEIAKVNQLQNDAKEAAEDVITGRRDDIEGVMLATQKADTAFRMLLQVRNKMMEAYEEVKQIRV